ncbi:WYL domain-containing protein [bacterium A37T11]|nr:WYL domain-containing protein [bacterium A37T11]
MLTDPKLGDIVVANSHPYWQENSNVNIAGDSQLISPLMVIVEILSEIKDRFDEKTGVQIAERGSAQCKCVWFAARQHGFMEAWFSSKSLKTFKKISENEVWANIPEGSEKKLQELRKLYLNRLVILKTAEIETSKKKISSSEIGYSEYRTTKTTFPQNNVSPTVEIIEVKIPENNKTNFDNYDPKTGTRKRYISVGLIKCRWYNQIAEKWSENVLPVEAVSLIEVLDLQKLYDISEMIESGGYYQLESCDLPKSIPRAEPTIILKPKALNYLNGTYFLAAHDIIHERIIDIPLSQKMLENLIEIVEKHVFTKDKHPNFNFSPGAKAPKVADMREDFIALVDKAAAENRYILIQYKNSNDKLSNRVLRGYFIVPKSEKNGKDYLHGYCCAKREIRTFRIDGIQSVKVLSLQFKTSVTRRRRVK